MTKKASVFISRDVKSVVEFSKNLYYYKDLGVAIEQMLMENPKFQKAKAIRDNLFNLKAKELNKTEEQEK